MSLYTSMTGTASNLLASFRDFWHSTLNLLTQRRKTRSIPLYLDIHQPPASNLGFTPKTPESEPESPQKGGTNGESCDSLPAISTPVISPDTSEPPRPEPTPVQNRHQRRAAVAWERERMKRDKWVTPKGELPVKVERAPRSPQPEVGADAGANPSTDLVPVDLTPVRIVHEANQVMIDDGVGFPENEIWGEFAFRDTILDQLERYWIYLARMRKHDLDAYEFYKQIGATVVPPVHWFLHKGVRSQDDGKPIKPKPPKPLSPWWKQNRPGFGCVTYGIYSKVEEDEMAARFEGKDKNKRMWVPKFLYFVKYRHPPANIQPTTGGDVYKMTVWWDKPQSKEAKKHKGGVPEDYAVYVSADGNDVHVLPMHETEYLPIRRKKPYHGYKRGITFHVPHRCWTIPRHYVNWAKAHGQDANTFLTSLFLDAAHSVEMAEYSMVRVSVHNGALTAAFGVDVKKLPYFFQDRDIVLTESGTARKRAFHLVRPHVRASGHAVKMHFRGEREFTWAGYRVSITIPARDHFMLTEFDVGVDHMAEVPRKERKLYLTEKKVAAMLVDKMKRGIGGTH
jgi:hypothetical protein